MQSELRWSILPFSMQDLLIARALAKSFLTGDQTADAIAGRCYECLGQRWAWLLPLIGRYLAVTRGQPRARTREIADFILLDASFRRAVVRYSKLLTVRHWPVNPQEMLFLPGSEAWNLPRIESLGQLADWLWLENGQLDWFADLKDFAAKNARAHLNHYNYRVLAKASGQVRLIEAPKSHLKRAQRQILNHILQCIPLHEAVHGFVKGRSIQTFAAPYVGKALVLRMDLRDFFLTFSGARIQAFFRTIGYPEAVADLLGGICTNATPRRVWVNASETPAPLELSEVRERYRRPHLPQGAPSSPALANLCFYRVDRRLSALARSAGFEYTRYADDLAFSGDVATANSAEDFSLRVAAILLESGFQVRHRKTRVMRAGVRQHLAGLVINEKLNIRRNDYEALKAILTNCKRYGPAGQNRDHHADFRAHLSGRVSFVESINPGKGERLRKAFEQIAWL